MHAVLRAHPRRCHARMFIDESRRDHRPLVASTELVRELMHVHMRTRGLEHLAE